MNNLFQKKSAEILPFLLVPIECIDGRRESLHEYGKGWFDNGNNQQGNGGVIRWKERNASNMLFPI